MIIITVRIKRWCDNNCQNETPTVRSFILKTEIGKTTVAQGHNLLTMEMLHTAQGHNPLTMEMLHTALCQNPLAMEMLHTAKIHNLLTMEMLHTALGYNPLTMEMLHTALARQIVKCRCEATTRYGL